MLFKSIVIVLFPVMLLIHTTNRKKKDEEVRTVIVLPCSTVEREVDVRRPDWSDTVQDKDWTAVEVHSGCS